jgi:hypothetical protein
MNVIKGHLNRNVHAQISRLHNSKENIDLIKSLWQDYYTSNTLEDLEKTWMALTQSNKCSSSFIEYLNDRLIPIKDRFVKVYFYCFVMLYDNVILGIIYIFFTICYFYMYNIFLIFY